MAKVALITGITGQDGSYLAEFLLEKGYEVHGITRRASISNTARIDHLMGKITLHDGDLSDSSSLIRIISLVNPDEIYNLAAQSHVQVSFDVPEYSGDVDALGVLRILEACRILGLTKKTKVYQASTSELYGKVEEVPQKETTPFHPYSPYAVAKQYGFWIVKEYREAYGMFAVNGILFNHESERRGENFVTRKITLAAGRIAEGLQDHLELGNMDSLRDWGYAKDYVECMWMIMQHETPEDFVIATGEQHTVRDFTEKAFAANGITIRWEGTGLDEKGYDALCMQTVLQEEKNMLKGISPLISPEMLKVLCEMGHGDEIVLADANFPSETTGKRVIRADGIGAADLLKAILPLFPLDTYEKDRFILMEVVPGDPVVPVIWDEYKKILNEQEPGTPVEFMERFAYYERAKNAYCVVATGETAQYANIILKKGVVYK